MTLSPDDVRVIAAESPLTCEHCHEAPATRLLVVDYKGNGRHNQLVCVEDAELSRHVLSTSG